MKMMIGLMIGLVFGVLATVLIVRGTSTARADDVTSQDVTTTGNVTGGDLSTLLPDVGKIYRQSLGSPYRQVEKEIYDPDIAAYYHQLMQETGLDKIGQDSN